MNSIMSDMVSVICQISRDQLTITVGNSLTYAISVVKYKFVGTQILVLKNPLCG